MASDVCLPSMGHSMCIQGGKYTEDDAKVVLVQILNVVSFCHLQGVVHRDLKPEDRDSSLKAIDFGLLEFVKPYEKLNDIVGSAYIESCIFRAVLKAYPRFTKPPWPSLSSEALLKMLKVDELFYLKEQFALLQPSKNGTINAMKESRAHEILTFLTALQYRRMDFEEFCAAVLSVYQLEALKRWDQHARYAYELFEKDGNRPIMIEELASLSCHSFFSFIYFLFN
ncbi:CDPK-related protein kinase [Bienertia sinuspersici]